MITPPSSFAVTFPHHTYQNDPAEGDHTFLSGPIVESVIAPDPSDVPDSAALLRKAGVVQVLLLHGTFAGGDAFGLVREIGRISPQVGRTLRGLGKRLFDQLAGEVGNYTQAFADSFQTLIDAPGDAIPVTPFDWSGENHHLGRAEAAILLLDWLLKKDWAADDRVLIWGHSHGGNVLALVSQILGASRAAREYFFRSMRTHYLAPITGKVDLPHWTSVQQSLLAEDTIVLPKLDVVTFGTPLRYRWQPDICPRPLHFVQHRPLIEDKPAQARFPDSVEEALRAEAGDYVQQFGIAGTNFLHYVFAWRSWNAERRLRKMLQPNIRRRDLLSNLRRGHRVSLDGTTLLVNYPNTPTCANHELFGHAVYTKREWLAFHLRETARRLYG